MMASQKEYIEGIKSQARDNINNSYEYMRIAWQSKYQRPRYEKWDDYTPEEMILEAWEQWYLDNPDALELKGIIKKKNPKTGYTYYSTGDPLIDELEKAFSRGETPDLISAFGHIKGGKDIFRSPVFVHSENTVRGNSIGEAEAPRKGYEGVQENRKGEKIDVAGAKVKHDDFTSDEWIKDALNEDPVLKAMQEKLGVKDANER